MKTLIPAAVLLLASCSAVEQTSTMRESLQIIEYAKLPPLPPSLAGAQNKLVVLFDVAGDGRVVDIRFVLSSGSMEWDAQAADSLRRWRFVPLQNADAQEVRRIMDTIVVRVNDPVLRTLQEIRMPTMGAAETVFVALEGGADFDSVAVRTEGMIRPHYTADITAMPPHVWSALKELEPMQWTKPLRVKEGYAVIRRVGE